MLHLFALIAFGAAAVCGILAAIPIGDSRLGWVAVGLIGAGEFLVNLP